MKKIISLLVISFIFIGFSAISINAKTSYKDGVYSAKSQPDSFGGYATIKITVTKGVISDCEYKLFTKDGKERDKTFGKTGDSTKDTKYIKAQKVLEAAATFGSKLVKTQDAEKIDGTTGATGAYKVFKDLVKKALSGKPESK